jgi:hypothetical protein
VTASLPSKEDKGQDAASSEAGELRTCFIDIFYSMLFGALTHNNSPCSGSCDGRDRAYSSQFDVTR